MTDELETVGKVADATAEVAKTGAKAIDAASDTGRFFNAVFGDLVIDGVGLLRDRLQFYRAERWILLGEKTRERLTAKGITNYRPVPPKIALPLIESATIEDDDDLHSLWANLLTSALDSDASAVERKFVSVLADMTVQDASVLNEIYDDWHGTKRIVAGEMRDGTLKFGENVDGTASHDEIAVITLNRLGLIAPSYVEFKTYEPAGHDDHFGEYGSSSDPVRVFYGDLEFVVVTPFGEAFCKAVIPNPSPDE